MFWDSGPTRIYGRHLRSCGLAGDEAMLFLDDGWLGFRDSLPRDETLATLTPAEVAELAGGHLDPDLFSSALAQALRDWRVSPSRSMVNLISDIHDGSPGEPMFKDMKTQTRVLASVIEAGAMQERDFNAVNGEDGKRRMISRDSYALTAVGDAARALNTLARTMKAWEERGRALVRTGRIKLPKALYRGIRHRDVRLPEDMTFADGSEWNFRRCEVAAAKAEAVASRPLRETCGSDILSFTSNERIAEYFTRNEGVVIAVEPSDLSLVTSWAADGSLDGHDQVTKRHEREWIMRVGAYVPVDVRTFDQDVMWSTGDPRGVAMLDANVSASYEMDGHTIEARFYWNASGKGGTIRFRVDGAFSQNRAEVKRRHGFDPIPREGSDLEVDYFQHDSLPSSRKRPFARWEKGKSAPAP